MKKKKNKKILILLFSPLFPAVLFCGHTCPVVPLGAVTEKEIEREGIGCHPSYNDKESTRMPLYDSRMT